MSFTEQNQSNRTELSEPNFQAWRPRKELQMSMLATVKMSMLATGKIQVIYTLFGFSMVVVNLFMLILFLLPLHIFFLDSTLIPTILLFPFLLLLLLSLILFLLLPFLLLYLLPFLLVLLLTFLLLLLTPTPTTSPPPFPTSFPVPSPPLFPTNFPAPNLAFFLHHSFFSP